MQGVESNWITADVSIDDGRLGDDVKTRFDEEMRRMMELCAAQSCFGRFGADQLGGEMKQ